jgi:hypothetical protein
MQALAGCSNDHQLLWTSCSDPMSSKHHSPGLSAPPLPSSAASSPSSQPRQRVAAWSLQCVPANSKLRVILFAGSEARLMIETLRHAPSRPRVSNAEVGGSSHSQGRSQGEHCSSRSAQQQRHPSPRPQAHLSPACRRCPSGCPRRPTTRWGWRSCTRASARQRTGGTCTSGRRPQICHQVILPLCEEPRRETGSQNTTDLLQRCRKRSGPPPPQCTRWVVKLTSPSKYTEAPM